jgi:copper transport protein
VHLLPRAIAGAIVALAVALGLLVAGARPAAAHAELVSSDPPAGSPLVGAPAEVVLLFSDVVEPAGATVQVLDSAGTDLAAGAVANRAGDPTSLVVATAGVAAPGALSVVFTLIGSDGHAMTGMVGYTVGSTGAAAEVAPAPPAATAAAAAAAAAERDVHLAERLAALARPASYLAFALLLGVPLFLVCIWPAGARTASARLLRVAGLVAGLAGAAATLGSIAVGLRGDGSPLTGLQRAVSTRTGRWVLVELALVVAVAVLGVALARGSRSTHDRWRAPAVVAAAALLLAHGRVGHAATEGWWATTVHGVHVGAMSAWIGGLVGLLLVAVPAWSSRGALKQEFHDRLQAFTRLASTAVGALLWSGVLLLVMAWSDGRRLGLDYRTALVVKLGAVAVTLAAGLAAHRLVRDEPARRPARTAVRSRVLTRRLTTEIALSAAVLAATAVLAGTSPAS